MALSILDGNQSATTLSTIVTGGQHIPAHTVVSLGTQAITDMRSAVSGSVVSISNFPTTQPISGTVTANIFGANVNGSTLQQIPIIGYDEDITAASRQITVPVQISSLNGSVGSGNPLPISGTVTIGSALPAGTNRIGVVTIGGGTVTIGAGIAQIGSVTASISGTVPISISSVTVGVLPDLTTSTDFSDVGTSIAAGITNYGSIPVAILAGTAQIGTVTASISNSVVTFYPQQGTTVSSTNFTSTTASTTLVSAVAGREVLTVFNEGAGNLHISPGATCTTISYQVRLSSGDYWECPAGQTSLAHTAVFATAGTARVTQVS